MENEKNPYEGKEESIMHLLKCAFDAFVKLDVMHPDDQQDFNKGIHECQNVIMRRITVRDYPSYFYNQQKIK